VSNVEETDGGQGTDEEDDIKPPMVEIELKITQHLRDN
jgi:hypothetical protein